MWNPLKNTYKLSDKYISKKLQIASKKLPYGELKRTKDNKTVRNPSLTFAQRVALFQPSVWQDLRPQYVQRTLN